MSDSSIIRCSFRWLMYNQLARYYDLIHENLTADIPYLLRLAAETGGPILELGCGSGRLLLPLARAEYDITGIDNSEVMLERAQQRLAAEPAAVQSRVHLLEGDMVSPGSVQQHGLVFAGHNTLMHLTPGQLAVALKNIYSALKPGGRLFVDLSNPFTLAEAADIAMLTLENVLQDSEAGEVVVQLAAERWEAAEQRVHVTWIFDASPIGGGPVRRDVVEMDYYYHYPHELELMLSQAGLRLLSLQGDYDGTPFEEESERMLVIAQPV